MIKVLAAAMQATYAAADYLERARPDEHRFAVGIDEFKFHSMSDALAFADVWTASATQDDRTGYPEGAEILCLFLGRSHDVFTHH